LTDSQIIAVLIEVMRDSFRKPDLTFNPEDRLRDMFGIDSVLFVALILSIEQRFSIMLPEDGVDQLTTVGSLFQLVKKTVSM